MVITDGFLPWPIFIFNVGIPVVSDRGYAGDLEPLGLDFGELCRLASDMFVPEMNIRKRKYYIFSPPNTVLKVNAL